MSKLRDAAQQAQQALEILRSGLIQMREHAESYGEAWARAYVKEYRDSLPGSAEEQFRALNAMQHRLADVADGVVKGFDAITALRTALAEQPAEQESVQDEYNRVINHAIEQGIEASVFLRCWQEGDWSGCAEFGFEPNMAAYTAPQPAKPAEQEPVAAQHRFRHPQKGTPDWSVWQPCKVAQRPAWEIDSQAYEVEYRALYTAPQPVKRVGSWRMMRLESYGAIQLELKW